jgi:hypothetical protein
MPTAFCASCLTNSRVRADQLGRRVICPKCRTKFTAVRPTPIQFNPVFAAMAMLGVAAIAIVVVH